MADEYWKDRIDSCFRNKGKPWRRCSNPDCHYLVSEEVTICTKCGIVYEEKGDGDGIHDDVR